MIKHIRIQEYKALIYRILLVYAFYSLVRILFTLFNLKFLKIDSLGQFFKLAFHGLTFDTTAILYVNSLFILLSIFPLWINTRKGYQTVLLYVYFITNLIAYATNFIDFIYYKYIYSRTTIAILDIAKHESNKGNMFFRFIISYWYVYLLFFITAFVWIKLYKLVRVEEEKVLHNWKYFLTSKIGVIIILVLSIGGIRGDFKKSTRPINLIDANQYVTKPQHADIVLNTPFALIRTFRTTTFQKVNYIINDSVLKNQIQPIKQYRNYPLTKPNIVVFITESFGREYWGCMNKNTTILVLKAILLF